MYLLSLTVASDECNLAPDMAWGLHMTEQRVAGHMAPEEQSGAAVSHSGKRPWKTPQVIVTTLDETENTPNAILNDAPFPLSQS